MILTAADVVDQAIEYAGAAQSSSDRARKLVRYALAEAVRDFPALHAWTYYRTPARFNLTPGYSTGTVQYDATTRHLTLTGGTWPTWAANGVVLVGTTLAEVATRDSGTVLTLDPVVTFGADVAAGTAYHLYLDRYQLPADFRAMGSPVPEVWFGALRYVPLINFLNYSRDVQLSTGVPQVFSLHADSSGRFFLRIAPYTDVARTLDYLYSRHMRPVVFDVGYTQGTATVVQNTTVVTGSETQFLPGMVGSVLRLGFDGTTPEAGLPVAFESRITAVNSTTEVEVEDAAPAALAGVGVQVSDPIDVDAGTMATAFSWLVRRNLAAAMHAKDLKTAEGQFVTALQFAKEADSRYVGRDRAGPLDSGWRRGSMPIYPDAP
jgi:hypothetical protein